MTEGNSNDNQPPPQPLVLDKQQDSGSANANPSSNVNIPEAAQTCPEPLPSIFGDGGGMRKVNNVGNMVNTGVAKVDGVERVATVSKVDDTGNVVEVDVGNMDDMGKTGNVDKMDEVGKVDDMGKAEAPRKSTAPYTPHFPFDHHLKLPLSHYTHRQVAISDVLAMRIMHKYLFPNLETTALLDRRLPPVPPSDRARTRRPYSFLRLDNADRQLSLHLDELSRLLATEPDLDATPMMEHQGQLWPLDVHHYDYFISPDRRHGMRKKDIVGGKPEPWRWWSRVFHDRDGVFAPHYRLFSSGVRLTTGDLVLDLLQRYFAQVCDAETRAWFERNSEFEARTNMYARYCHYKFVRQDRWWDDSARAAGINNKRPNLPQWAQREMVKRVRSMQQGCFLYSGFTSMSEPILDPNAAVGITLTFPIGDVKYNTVTSKFVAHTSHLYHKQLEKAGKDLPATMSIFTDYCGLVPRLLGGRWSRLPRGRKRDAFQEVLGWKDGQGGLVEEVKKIEGSQGDLCEKEVGKDKCRQEDLADEKGVGKRKGSQGDLGGGQGAGENKGNQEDPGKGEGNQEDLADEKKVQGSSKDEKRLENGSLNDESRGRTKERQDRASLPRYRGRSAPIKGEWTNALMSSYLGPLENLFFQPIKLSEMDRRCRRRSLSRRNITDMFDVTPQSALYRDFFPPPSAPNNYTPPQPSLDMLSIIEADHPNEKYLKPRCGFCGEIVHKTSKCPHPKRARCKCRPFPQYHLAVRCPIVCSRRCGHKYPPGHPGWHDNAMTCKSRCCMCGMKGQHTGRDCWLKTCRCGEQHLGQDCGWNPVCGALLRPGDRRYVEGAQGEEARCELYLCGHHCRRCGSGKKPFVKFLCQQCQDTGDEVGADGRVAWRETVFGDFEKDIMVHKTSIERGGGGMFRSMAAGTI